MCQGVSVLYRLRSSVTTVAWWSVAVLAAVAISVSAMIYVRSSFDRQPDRQPGGVIAQPQSQTPTARTTPGAIEPPPSPNTDPTTSSDRTFAITGGSVVARCTGPEVYLVYWSPLPGFSVVDVHRGPALRATIVFAAAGRREIEYTFACVRGTPVVNHDDDGWHDDDTGHDRLRSAWE